MKYTFYTALIAACALAFVACGEKKEGEAPTPPAPEATPAPEAAPAHEAAPMPEAAPAHEEVPAPEAAPEAK